MKRNVAKTAHAKGLALLLAAGMLVSQMSGVSADAKAKKPKLSRTKVSVTVGKTKRVTVKNAKKVTWKVTKKAAQIVKLTKKSKKGATIKGLKKGTAKISVQMKNGKKKVKKTITVKVSSAKKVVVTAEPAKTTNKPTNGPTNGPTKEPVKEPTATPTATSTTEPLATPTATPTEEPPAEPTATPTATSTTEPSAEPTATSTPMPLPDLGENDVKIDLTKENEYGQNSVLEDTITYYEGNGVSYTSTGEASGGGVAYWTNAGKSGIDLSKYKSIRIVASSDAANTPVVCELLKSNPANIWGGGIDVFDGFSEYNAITEAGKAQVFEFQISDALAAALAEGTLAYGIRLKYNAYHTDGDDLPNRNFNIYSIILMGKDDVPEPTVAPSEPEEPTPTPGVASGSAAVVVTATGSAAGLDLEEGDTLDLNASVSTTGCAVTGDIVWTSSNEEVATVSASGASATVTAVGEGTATIKATITTDTGIVTYDKYDVTVVASDLVLEGDDLGAGASYTYVPNGFALYASMGIFEIDKSKLSKEGTTISIKYTAMEGDTDVKDTQRFNIGLKTGDKWNSPAIKDYYGKTGGEVNLTLTADDMKKIGADDKVYVHVGTGTAGFKGTFTYLSVTAGEDSLVSELPKAVSYVESGLAQLAPTAKVMLPSDIDFKQYSKCQIEFTASDPTFEFHGIVGHKVNGKDVTDPKYGVTSEGYFEVNLSNVKKEEGTEPFVVINAGKAGYAGSVTITKITFVK